MSLSEDISNYYFDNLEKFDQTTQFHFASRLSSWNNEPRAIEILDKLKPWIATPASSPDAFKKYALDLLESPPKAKINAAGTREQYFTKYPQLRSLDFILFRLRHLMTIYEIDVRDYLTEVVSSIALEQLADALVDDYEAIKILSTYAVNYLYLLEILFDYRNIPRNAYLDIAKSYDEHDPEQSLLLIYLFTHCIIGASNFYVEKIPESDRDIYLAMLKRIENLITDNYDFINLDSKFEFLVCCRICEYQSSLFDRIDEEASRSVSENGTFIVDRHNNRVGTKTTLQDSEHRNVLYIMAQTPYRQ